jgi:hypothetical protein
MQNTQKSSQTKNVTPQNPLVKLPEPNDSNICFRRFVFTLDQAPMSSLPSASPTSPPRPTSWTGPPVTPTSRQIASCPSTYSYGQNTRGRQNACVHAQCNYLSSSSSSPSRKLVLSRCEPNASLHLLVGNS